MWALSLLKRGDIDGADSLLMPRPDRCDASLALPVVTVLLLHNEEALAERCATQSGQTLALLRPAALRLLNSDRDTDEADR